MAFFLESTFVAVMFFGWNKVSRKFHLVSTWLVAVGANLSALWILVANAWMQNPVGMVFNPETARNEMVNFMALLFNPVAVDKFLHTIFSGFLLASVFVTGISAWFLLKSRERWLASRSILIASVFGFLSTLMVAFTGDMSTRTIARVQPVKFAAIEALGEGKNNAGLVVLGILGNPGVKINEREIPGFTFKIEVPGLLSFLAGGDNKTHVPGLKELVNGGNPDNKILPVAVRMERGRKAKDILDDYKEAKMLKDEANIKRLAAIFRDNDFIDNYFRYFGYAFLEKPEDAIPDVAVSFYSFRVMVMLGLFFIVLFGMTLILLFRGTLEANRWFLRIAVASIPLAYIASESGWVLSEMGRQPWIIQDLMLVSVAVTNVGTASVITTFILFAILFTALLVAELSIMIKQVKSGP
jgi:cytochrome d ubiquinol oxidase subunit I